VGRNAKRKKNKKFQLPALSIPPVGTRKYFSKGNFANGAVFEVDIVESARTQRFLVCLDPNPLDIDCQPVTVTVWDTLERAMAGGNEVLDVLENYTFQQLLERKVYQEFLNKLSNDDDQVIAVIQNGKIHTDTGTRMAAMKECNAVLIEKQAKSRFRVNGETVL
jgi:hypothetical protein